MKTLLISASFCLLSISAFCQETNQTGTAKTGNLQVKQTTKYTPHRAPNANNTPAKSESTGTSTQQNNQASYKCPKCGYTSTSAGVCPHDVTKLEVSGK